MRKEEPDSFQKMRPNEEEELRSSRKSESDKLRAAKDHQIGIYHHDLSRNAEYRSCFNVKERIANWFLNCFTCSDAENSFVDMVADQELRHPALLSDDYKKLMKEKIIKMKIIETSRLQLDPNVMHPFVKVHIVNKDTGCYLKVPADSQDSIVYQNQNLTCYDPLERKYYSTTNDIILPFATNCCDFRELGNSRGLWNEKFFINAPAEEIIKAETVILFQILDFNHQALLDKDIDIYDKDNFFRVAWGFLRPVGLSKTHIGKSKVELFRYKFNTKKDTQVLDKAYIPQVYYEFIWNNHEKYEGYLTVQLNYTARPKIRYIEEDQDYPLNIFEEERLDRKYLERYGGPEQRSEIDDDTHINENLLKFCRNRDICEIPKEIVYKLDSAKRGCFRLKFVGNYLFAACSAKNNTLIKAFSLQNGSHIMSLKGHREMVYTMTATPNEKYMITGGSDNVVRVWAVPNSLGEFIDEEESEVYIKGECVHTAAIYSASVIHTPLQDIIYIMSCCYDGYVRLWEGTPGNNRCLLEREFLINTYERVKDKKVYPTCCVSCDSAYFVVGDSIGDIRIFDFAKDRFHLRCTISNPELDNDLIQTIHMISKSHIMIQASDNLIRHFQLSGNRLRLSQKYSGAQFEKYLMNCVVSPDNKYLLCPSESGKPFLWDVFTALPVDLSHLNLHIKGPLISCDWHPKYNLVAMSGFVEQCPIFVFGNVLSENEIKLVLAQQH